MLRFLLLLCFASPAHAGLFSDDDARDKIQQLEARVSVLEDAAKQQVKSMMDLQSQIEALNSEIRKLRGQNEEMAHALQDAEKRQKDFYVDLDTRVRHFESAEEAAKEAAAKEAAAREEAAKEAVAESAVVPVAAAPAGKSDPSHENRAIKNAFVVFKGGNHADAVKAFQEFLNKYPKSTHAPNAKYWLGRSQFALKNYKSALTTYQGLLKAHPDSPEAADAMLGIAASQRGLKRTDAAHKTLKQLIAKYPASEAAAKAKKLLPATK